VQAPEGARIAARRRLALALLAAVAVIAQIPSPAGASLSDLPASARQVIHKKRYENSTWALRVVDPRTGKAVFSASPRRQVIPGSTGKLYSISTALDELGPGHRFETPVFGTGPVQGSVLSGNLVLVASGDLVLGGRGAIDGEVAFRNIDHTDANAVPGAKLTPQDPLAGLDALAAQVRAAGVTSVTGDVVIDDRLFETATEMNPEAPATPIMVNENVIDLLTTPTDPGQPAELFWRPQTASYQVTSTVMTVAAGGTTEIEVDSSEEGRIELSGTIAADSEPQLKTAQIADPAGFARIALIEALARAGVTVAAPATGTNPEGLLPPEGSYVAPPLALLTSPPYSEYIKLILKVSHNLGANLSVCLVAVNAGSDDCDAGFPVMRRFLRQAGVNNRDVSLNDGQGGKRSDLVTPHSTSDVVDYWRGQDEFQVFKQALPIMGVDGSLAQDGRNTTAKGKVFAKTGTLVDFDLLNNRLQLGTKGLGGYIRAGGRLYPFGLYVNNARIESVQDIFAINEDLARIAAALRAQL
jgi:D-alanyl-D-alanine carboxypeptidase/D-alanyl-D-alanine-endopeptidase (penicillin-binding protein 4)